MGKLKFDIIKHLGPHASAARRRRSVSAPHGCNLGWAVAQGWFSAITGIKPLLYLRRHENMNRGGPQPKALPKGLIFGDS